MYKALRWLIGLAMGFYFRRIERFHAERVPGSGPVLFTSNHPNSLTDSFVVGASLPRKVSFIATVQLFRFAPIKWILLRSGVIPINRAQDNPRGMKSVAGAFEACFRVLETGEAVAIFPEGITYDDANLKQIKTGAARMALELEQRRHGKLGLKVCPVGLTYSQKERYRSDVLVHFGEPIAVAEFLAAYSEHRHECIQKLTYEIERRIAALIVHLPKLEHERLIIGVKRLYFDAVQVGEISAEPVASGADELERTQRIIEIVERVYETEPDRANAFATRLAAYERALARCHLSNEDVARLKSRRQILARMVAGAVLIILGAPLALYGWIHRLLPYSIIKLAARKLAQPGKKKAQASTASILAGVVAFAFCFALYVLIFDWLLGWPATVWYALSLPPASLLASYYTRAGRKWLHQLRIVLVFLRARGLVRRLLAMRAGLISELEAVRKEQVTKTPENRLR
jgi:glycerol-3-phosphate O-acyltransferase / dihydroxyacetone phosphate acyltransferase